MSTRKRKRKKSTIGARPAASITDPHKQPIIAVFSDWGSVGSAFKEYGARVVEVDSDHKAEQVLPFVDAIAFTGGGDVDPKRYGATPHRSNYGTSRDRDEREFKAVAYAKEHKLPMFGICRGLQLLNVAHGGSLDQHIDDNTESFSHEGKNWHVKLRRASRFSQSSGLVGLTGTHLHHQRIARLGEGLLPVGWAHDGTIEFIENAPNNPNVIVATQFHPEMDYVYDDDAGLVFQHFVQLVSKRMRPDVMGRWKKVKPKFLSSFRSYDYSNPTKGVRVKGTDGAWRYEIQRGTTTTGTEDERYNKWWDDKLHRSDIGLDDDDDEEFLQWARLNEQALLDFREEEACDARCAFPPCRDPHECMQYNDCEAEAVALKDSARRMSVEGDHTTLVTMSVEEYERILAQKRGSKR